VEGIDVTRGFGLDLAIVPHWNNAEGGTHDTRFCYMGEARFRVLEEQLPGEVTVLGLDEHTACLLDLELQRAEVRGIGRVTVRRGGRERTFGKGESFPFAVLRGETGGEDVKTRGEVAAPTQATDGEGGDFWGAVHGAERAFQAAVEARDPSRAVMEILNLDRHLWQAQAAHEDEAAIVEAREVLREMVVLLGTGEFALGGDPEAALSPVLDRLLALRERWRADGKWAEADALRDCLQAAGVVVEDAADGPRWRVDR